MNSDHKNDADHAGQVPAPDPHEKPLSAEELAGDIDEPGKGGDIDEPGKGGDTVDPGVGGDEFPDGREDFDEPGKSPSEVPSQPVPDIPNLPPD